jgi:cob(I)alamin adenosyltransferase
MSTGSTSSSTTAANDNQEDETSSIVVHDIEELHHQALSQKATTYIDPTTGFTVWTERAHLLRGTCCGNQCRHCPYGWVNVNARAAVRNNHQGPLTTSTVPVPSGDVSAVQVRLQALDVMAGSNNNNNQQKESSTSAAQQDRSTNTVHNKTTKTGGRHGGRLTDKNVPYTRGGDQGMSSLLTGERRSKSDLVFDAMGTVDELCTVVGVVHALLVEQQQQLKQQQKGEQGTTDQTAQVAVLEEQLLDIMSRLFDIGSHIAKPLRSSVDSSGTQHKKKDNDDGWSSSSSSDDEEKDNGDTKQPRFVADGMGGGFDPIHVQQLEDWIDVMTQDLPELTSFLLPTGSVIAAQLHVARTVARRSERVMVPLVVDRRVCDPTALKYVNRLSDYFFTAARWVNVILAQSAEIQYRRPHRKATQRQRTTTTTTAR